MRLLIRLLDCKHCGLPKKLRLTEYNFITQDCYDCIVMNMSQPFKQYKEKLAQYKTMIDELMWMSEETARQWVRYQRYLIRRRRTYMIECSYGGRRQG